MNNSKVSIIVPVYNVKDYLCRCIDSILKQTYENLEIILVDDGSNDGSSNLCDMYKKKDHRILVIHKENGGLSDARNAGIKQSTGRFIMFIDSDDYVDENIVNTLYNNILSTGSDISICSYYSVKNGLKSSPHFSKKEFVVKDKDKFYNLYNEYSGVTVSSCMKLYKSEIFDHLTFSKGTIHEDEIIILDVLKKSSKVSYILEPLYYYEMRDGSITKKFDIRKLDVLPYMDKRIDYFKSLNDSSLVEMTKYKKLYIKLLLIEDYYTYKVKNKEHEVLKTVKKGIKLEALKCTFYKSLSVKSKVNSAMAFILPFCVYSKLKGKMKRK